MSIRDSYLGSKNSTRQVLFDAKLVRIMEKHGLDRAIDREDTWGQILKIVIVINKLLTVSL